MDDQYRSEQETEGRRLDRKQRIKALLVLLLILFAVMVCVVLFQAWAQMSQTLMQF